MNESEAAGAKCHSAATYACKRAELMQTFRESYLDHTTPFELVAYTHSSEGDSDRIAARLLVDGEERIVEGEGNGPIAALVDAIGKGLGVEVQLRDYHEHAMSEGEDATAAAYVEAEVDGDVVWGVGIHPSIVTASLRAVLNAATARSRCAEQEAAAAAFDAS
ncbi:MAG: alpha-isopropylmalate synthase regulatory domain-containing protein [Gaiellaceae bacterium]